MGVNECPECEGEGYLIIEDVDEYHLRECKKCKGEGVVGNDSSES